MLSQAEHQNRVEEICLGKVIRLSPGEIQDCQITPEQLLQLLDEGLVHPQSSYNNRPTIQDFMRFLETIEPFRQEDLDIQVVVCGHLSRGLGINECSNIQLVIESFEIKNQSGCNIDQAVLILPIVSQFITQPGRTADEFKLMNNLFTAWWD
ncbi:hypothetical protein [Nostoc sp. FACHB-280]|uniref:hypothetical protein n=1 Tax=Nostoc sp. FACHB-280 TaxID=2692839 RepID=UPI00168B8329|nr:hypothetical protein [Nostoc sp. FACHB-280]MBD2498355.1 hypothetical protein [Nostoc sp. FACHB-280]